MLACVGTFQQLLSYVVFTGWIFYALGAACVFVYRKTNARGEAALPGPGLSVDTAAVHTCRRLHWWVTR
jgi:APA family basic amino acid/polyamine antiporter